MNSITIKETNPILTSIIDKVNESHQPTLITVENKKAVLVSVEEWDSIQETLYLLSIPGVKDNLIEKHDQKSDKNLDTLSWKETYQAMAQEKEDWSDFDVTIADGLEGESFDS